MACPWNDIGEEKIVLLELNNNQSSNMSIY